MKKNKSKSIGAINPRAYIHLKKIISPMVEIVDMVVKGKWLCATLDSNMTFSVLNQDQHLEFSE